MSSVSSRTMSMQVLFVMSRRMSVSMTSFLTFIHVLVVGVVLLVRQHYVVNCPGELLNRELLITSGVELVEYSGDFILSEGSAFSLGEEVSELFDVKVAVAILVRNLHPLLGHFLHTSHSQLLAVGLLVKGLHDTSLLLFENLLLGNLLGTHVGRVFLCLDMLIVELLEGLYLSDHALDGYLLVGQKESRVDVNAVNLLGHSVLDSAKLVVEDELRLFHGVDHWVRA